MKIFIIYMIDMKLFGSTHRISPAKSLPGALHNSAKAQFKTKALPVLQAKQARLLVKLIFISKASSVY